MKKKLSKYIKFLVSMALILSLVAPSYASLSASDGSAFVTKAEFDSALADFNSRLTTFEAGINSKIDSQVTSYLDRNGIWSGKVQDVSFDLLHGELTRGKEYTGWTRNTAEEKWAQYTLINSENNKPKAYEGWIDPGRAIYFKDMDKGCTVSKTLVNEINKSGLLIGKLWLRNEYNLMYDVPNSSSTYSWLYQWSRLGNDAKTAIKLESLKDTSDSGTYKGARMLQLTGKQDSNVGTGYYGLGYGFTFQLYRISNGAKDILFRITTDQDVFMQAWDTNPTALASNYGGPPLHFQDSAQLLIPNCFVSKSDKILYEYILWSTGRGSQRITIGSLNAVSATSTYSPDIIFNLLFVENLLVY